MRRMLIVVAMSALLLAGSATTQQKDRVEVDLQAAIRKETVEGKLKEAIEMYKKLAQSGNRAVAAKALVRMGQCYDKLGDAESRKAYERVVRDFADQKEAVEEARKLLAAKGGPVGAGGLVTRRVLTDASGVGGVLTSDGKYISHIDRDSGDLVQFEVASGQTRRIINRGPWSETEKSYEYAAFSRDGKQIA